MAGGVPIVKLFKTLAGALLSWSAKGIPCITCATWRLFRPLRPIEEVCTEQQQWAAVAYGSAHWLTNAQ